MSSNRQLYDLPYECKYCSFTTSYTNHVHNQNQAEDHSFRCPSVSKLPTKRAYCNFCTLFNTTPAQVFQEDGDYTKDGCKWCGYKGSTDNSTTRPRWKCDLCPRVFRTFEEAVEHEQKCNESDDGRTKTEVDHETIEFNGSIIPPPKNGKTYAPIEAVKLITSLTAKGTTERKELILLLLDKQYVKGRTTIYDTIKKFEEGKSFSLFWRERGAPRKYNGPVANNHTERNVDHDYHPYNNVKDQIPIKNQIRATAGEEIWSAGAHLEEKGWRGSIYLEVTPIQFQMIEGYGKFDYHVRPKDSGKLRSKHADLFLGWNQETIRVDICKYLGQRNTVYDHAEDKWYVPEHISTLLCRLYFCTKRFPPPKDMDEGGNNEVFSRLKNYIMTCAVSGKKNDLQARKFDEWGCPINVSNSPVTCNGGRKKYHNKVFRCKHARKGSTKCPMNFTVCWDEYGYYINLISKLKRIQKGRAEYFNGSKRNDFKLERGTNSVGCQWHCCGNSKDTK